jgi:hypothetical protein
VLYLLQLLPDLRRHLRLPHLRHLRQLQLRLGAGDGLQLHLNRDRIGKG